VRDEWNIFEGFGSSFIAQAILIVIVFFQVVIVQFGGELMQTAPLSAPQWGACAAVGALSIPVGYLLKLVPASAVELRAIAPAPLAGARAADSGAGDETPAAAPADEATTPARRAKKKAN